MNGKVAKKLRRIARIRTGRKVMYGSEYKYPIPHTALEVPVEQQKLLPECPRAVYKQLKKDYKLQSQAIA